MIHGDLCHELLIDQMKPKLAFGSNMDLQTWKKQLKEKFIELTGFDLIAANACEPQFEIVSKVQQDGYQQIRFEFYSEIEERVPCYLLIPDGNKENIPLPLRNRDIRQDSIFPLGNSKTNRKRRSLGMAISRCRIWRR